MWGFGGGRGSVLKVALLSLCTLVAALTVAIPAAAGGGTDVCGYANSSFVESTVMRWAQVNGSGTSARIVAFANDEKALLLGVNGATPNTSSPQHLSNASGGSATAKDGNGRVFFPALYITNLTAHPTGNPGDFQNGGQPVNVSGGHPFVNDIFGTWATGSLSGGNYSATTPSSQNNWTLGSGSDTPVGATFSGLGDEGYGSEVRWNVSSLTDSDGHTLQPGDTYRIQILTHDGDQYHGAAHAGGDSGEFCAQLSIPRPPRISTTATSNTTGQPVHDTATVAGSGGAHGTVSWTVYSGTGCNGTGTQVGSAAINGDGTVTSPDYTPANPGQYQWVASYSSSAGNVSTSCTDANEVSTVSNPPAPGIKLVKLERDGSAGTFVPGPITVKVGDTIEYQLDVSNTGNTPLALNLSDAVCGGTLSAPTVIAGTYDATTNTLSPGATVEYNCSHLLSAGDASPFVNTATATGTPPSGGPVSATSSVVANKQSLLAKKVKKCPAGKVKKTRRNKKGKRVVVCVARKLSHRPHSLTGFTGRAGR